MLTSKSISGAYGPISRYLYYAFLVIPMILHGLDWLIAGTLGVSMIFSSGAAIHAIPLAAFRGQDTVDLDIIPVFAITGFGMLVGTPMLIWSKTLREAASSARAIVFLWIVLMFAGSLASFASLRAVPRPRQCDVALLPKGSCGLTCNTTLPMRSGQSIVSVPCDWQNQLFNYSGLFAAFGPLFAIMSLIYAYCKYTYSPNDSGVTQIQGFSFFVQRRISNKGKLHCCALLIAPLGLALALAQIIVLERVMMGGHHAPVGEGLDAVGQWSTIVGAFFAIVATVMKFLIDKKRPVSNETELELNEINQISTRN